MKRTIRFRAWYREKMIYPDTPPEGINDYIADHYGDTGVNVLHQVIEYLVDNGDLMQFTGLLDKNGVEIYEGDLVRTTDGEITEVIYNNLDTRFDFARGWSTDDIEVIANRYEHPHLLQPTTKEREE